MSVTENIKTDLPCGDKILFRLDANYGVVTTNTSDNQQSNDISTHQVDVLAGNEVIVVNGLSSYNMASVSSSLISCLRRSMRSGP